MNPSLRNLVFCHSCSYFISFCFVLAVLTLMPFAKEAQAKKIDELDMSIMSPSDTFWNLLDEEPIVDIDSAPVFMTDEPAEIASRIAKVLKERADIGFLLTTVRRLSREGDTALLAMQRRLAMAITEPRFLLLDSPPPVDRDQRLYFFMSQSVVARSRDKPEKAIDTARNALEIDPLHPITLNLLGRAVANVGEYREALRYFEKAIDLVDDFSAAYLNKGAALLALGELDRADMAFRAALNVEPDHCRALLGRALIAEEKGYIDNALAILERCQPRQPAVRLAIERLKLSLNLDANRIESAKAIIASMPITDPYTVKMSVELALRENDPGAAETILNTLVDYEDIELAYLAVLTSVLEERYTDADERLSALIEKAPASSVGPRLFAAAVGLFVGKSIDFDRSSWVNEPAVLTLANFLRGLALAGRGDERAAVQAWERANDFLPGFDMAGIDIDSSTLGIGGAENKHLALGTLLFLKQYHLAAKEHFTTARKINPRSLFSHFLSGVNALELGESEAARQYFESAHRIANRFFTANYLLAELSLSARQFERALEYLEMAFESRKDPGVALRIGMLYAERSDGQGKAVEAYRTLIDLTPDSFIGYNQLAWFFARRGDRLDEALDLATKADELMPGNAAINDTLGWILYQQGKFDEARQRIEAAYEISGESNPDILYHLASIEYQDGNHEQASTYLLQAFASPRNFESQNAAQALLSRIQLN